MTSKIIDFLAEECFCSMGKLAALTVDFLFQPVADGMGWHELHLGKDF